ncbi:MAG: FAD-dependent oxidoreductase, partial [Ornithinimicrobium sp.]
MRYDAVVIGAGHNGLTSAAYLARAGRSVMVLERADVVGGAARSARVFPAHDARLSAYSYLVSLMPQQVIDELGLDLTLHRRRISSYTPTGDSGILIDNGDPGRTASDLGPDAQAWDDFYAMTGEVAERLFPTMLQPLRSARDVADVVGPGAWQDLFM